MVSDRAQGGKGKGGGGERDRKEMPAGADIVEVCLEAHEIWCERS